MNKDIKAEWVKKLRSGAYLQTKNVLKRTEPDVGNSGIVPSGYCCLGVLCEIAVENEIGVWVATGRDYAGFSRSGQSAFLPTDVARWAEIRYSAYSSDDDDEDADVIGELMGMNDSGVPFAEIADYIEEHL